MAERGYLEAAEMMGMFTFMRSNDLVWNYAVNNWLMGEDPQPFDILAWNADSTRMPANMHSFYLRSCYLGNELAGGTMELAGTRLAPRRDPRRPLRRRRDRGPHRAVGGQLPHHPGPAERGRPLRAQLGGAHRRDRQPAEPEGVVPDRPRPPRPTRRPGSRPRTSHEGSWWEDWAEWIAAALRRAGAAPDDGEPQAQAGRGRARDLRAREVAEACAELKEDAGACRTKQCVL